MKHDPHWLYAVDSELPAETVVGRLGLGVTPLPPSPLNRAPRASASHVGRIFRCDQIRPAKMFLVSHSKDASY